MKKKKPSFIPYQQHQLILLPPSLEELVPENHVVRVVNRVIDSIDLRKLYERYEGGGRSSFHPAMMLKIIIYAYTQKIYTCRLIAKECRENIMFMWLSGRATPDYITINRFRSQRMKDIIVDIFAEVVELLHREGYIKLENYFLDGTKIEANANKYSWVWGENIKRFKENLRKKCTELIEEIEDINEQENAAYGEQDLEELGIGKEINSTEIKELAERINERLSKNPADKKLTRAKKVIEKDYLPRMEKYEKQEEILQERRSYSKTDTDATFMRMKEDHLKNSELKPGYNVQIGTENQFILSYSVHQRPGDTSCMMPHLEQAKEILGELPPNIVADAGYGSEENYEYLKEKELNNYVKYNTFHKEASNKWKKDLSKVQNWKYDAEKDEYICGYGRRLAFIYEKHKKSDNGHTSTIRVYRGLECQECLFRNRCVKSDKPEHNREIYINRRLDELKAEARINLTSGLGLKLRSLRPIEPETAFGDIKANLGIRRFLLRGLKKVKVEWGLISIAYNMRKMAAMMG